MAWQLFRTISRFGSGNNFESYSTSDTETEKEERERGNDGNGRISEAQCWGLGVDVYLETKAGNGGVVIQACYTNRRERTGGFDRAKREGEKRGERTATNTREP